MKTSRVEKSRKKMIAVFGSAFNPPHRGHADVVRQALEKADCVLLVPSYRHAFGKHMAPYDQRLAMAAAMAASLNELGDIRVCDIERAIAEGKDAGEAIYTYDVLCALEEGHPDASLLFVLGPDNAEPATWNKFYRAQDILDRWGTWAAEERIAVRSTRIRDNLAKAILPSEIECSVGVIELIKAMNCYGE